MRLEFRRYQLLKDTGKTKIFELTCSYRESIYWKHYTIDSVPLLSYNKKKCEWEFDCYTDNVGTGIIISPGTDKEVVCWDRHLTFIIPAYWKGKGLREGFYEYGKYPNHSTSLENYVRRCGQDGEKDIDYCLQYCGGGGDPEYQYLKSLCDFDDTLSCGEDIIFDQSKTSKAALMEILPMGVRTRITVELPYDKCDMIKKELYEDS